MAWDCERFKLLRAGGALAGGSLELAPAMGTILGTTLGRVDYGEVVQLRRSANCCSAAGAYTAPALGVGIVHGHRPGCRFEFDPWTRLVLEAIAALGARTFGWSASHLIPSQPNPSTPLSGLLRVFKIGYTKLYSSHARLAHPCKNGRCRATPVCNRPARSVRCCS